MILLLKHIFPLFMHVSRPMPAMRNLALGHSFSHTSQTQIFHFESATNVDNLAETKR